MMKIFKNYTDAKKYLNTFVSCKPEQTDMHSVLNGYQNYCIFSCLIDSAQNLITTKFSDTNTNSYEWIISYKENNKNITYSVENKPDILKNNGLSVAFIVCRAKIVYTNKLTEFGKTKLKEKRNILLIDRDKEKLKI
ncbi:hypothetical protein RVBP17_2680 [Pseudomonas phage sp. 30-3]|nr:hypothetical protein Cassandra_0167 [Pseudomonas phage Cassandra]WPK39876.1 hypothetical protein ETTORE_0167 [Pseudomonas phage Ettore]BDR26225.1 hypothetical protein RVBP17_2680 [Pseudomonas phage sp. 30-3]